TGAIVGTPNTVGTSTFTVMVQDAVGSAVTRQFTVTINVPVSITTTSLPDWTKDLTGYSQTVIAGGGSLPLTFRWSPGALPQGLSLNASTGVVSGTPGTVGSSTFTIKALDAVGSSASQQYTVAIVPPFTASWTPVATPTMTAVSTATI